jgi:hypothetical protein
MNQRVARKLSLYAQLMSLPDGLTGEIVIRLADLWG